MPEPDVVVELNVGNTCPSDDDLQKIQEVVKSAVPLGADMRALRVCSERQQLDGMVLSIGLWADDGGETDAQLETALLAASLLIRGRSAALSFAPNAIQLMASASWSRKPKKIDKKIGFIRLGENIAVTIGDGHIVTRITGQYKVRFAPNISFTVTMRDRLNLRRLGPPPLDATTTTKVSPNLAKVAIIAALLSPTLGILTFWQGDKLIPTPSGQGAGGALAAQWPQQILTEIDPPDLPGKIVLLWADLVVDDRGVRTLGAFIPVPRTSAAVIKGPSAITVELPANSARRTYEVITQDLRGDLAIRWTIDGAPAGREAKEDVRFSVPGRDAQTIFRRLQVEVRDEDGVVETDELRVRFEVKLRPGMQPF
jgi:hypothetical protein